MRRRTSLTESGWADERDERPPPRPKGLYGHGHAESDAVGDAGRGADDEVRGARCRDRDAVFRGMVRGCLPRL
jgi:hypothetical protein